MARSASPAKKCLTRDALIEAAHTLIWQNSYAHVSVDDICRSAGVQKGSFYHFFPTKSDLAAAALEAHWQTSQAKFDRIFTENHTAQGQLKALCHEVYLKQKDALDATGKVCGCPYATVGAEMSSNSEPLRQLSEQMNQRFLSYFEKLVQHVANEGHISSKEVKLIAREMQVYAIGAMLQARITNTLDSVGPALETALFRMCSMKVPVKKAAAASKLAKKPVRLVKKR